MEAYMFKFRFFIRCVININTLCKTVDAKPNRCVIQIRLVMYNLTAGFCAVHACGKNMIAQ